jgi:glutathione S-transferase
MQAVDEVLELATDMLSSYGPITLPFLPGFKDRKEVGQPKWLEEKLPMFLERLCALKKKRCYKSCYLVTECLSVADIVMFSHFWKLSMNPCCEDTEFAEKIKACCCKYPEIDAWLKQMCQDLCDVIPKLAQHKF